MQNFAKAFALPCSEYAAEKQYDSKRTIYWKNIRWNKKSYLWF